MHRGERQLLLATSNPAKQKRLAWLLEGLGFSLRRPQELSLQLQVEETASTHDGNASLKAVVWSQAVGGLVIASDGGLLIPALGPSWQSVNTARFAGPDADDRARLERLLELMAPYSGEERQASWLEAVAVAQDGALLACWQARSGSGHLATTFDPQRIVPGFWADTLWYMPDLGMTLAELSEQQREQVVGEHWGQLKDEVQRFFRQAPTLQGGKP